jgi:hypothetical protein
MLPDADRATAVSKAILFWIDTERSFILRLRRSIGCSTIFPQHLAGLADITAGIAEIDRRAARSGISVMVTYYRAEKIQNPESAGPRRYSKSNRIIGHSVVTYDTLQSGLICAF